MPGILLIWIMVGKGLNVLAIAGGGVVHIFILLLIIFLFFLPLSGIDE